MNGGQNIYFGCLSGNRLKIIACASMFIDHVGLILFPEVIILRVLGRLAMPLFAFTFAEGCFYTHNKAAHFLLVFFTGIITSVAMSFAWGEAQGNILITFSLSCLLIYAIDGIKRAAFARSAAKIALNALFFAAALALSVWLCCFSPISVDYGIAGVCLPVTVRLLDFRSYGAKGALAALYTPAAVFVLFGLGLVWLAVSLGLVQVFGLLALVPVMLYGGQRGRRGMKYFFYVFYPAHLALLGGIRLLLQAAA